MADINNPHYQTIPQRLRQFRRHLGLSQVEMAERLDIKQGTISAMEAGKNDVTVRTIYQLIDLDCNPAWLLLGEGPLSYTQASSAKATVEVRQLAGGTEYIVRVKQ